ncbi:LysR family transcriptional regulator [Zobellella maritima]|uniref:LysR substrate-binding domain-containing protein n=1 Tax=Zobellella maritima TaxID=2059725 RepID=UPI000E2FFB83|nr:LysR family transcriptional regulator [Zobellella maritima]
MTVRYEIRHLKHFIAVAEELNFRRAAERLNLAQPALSRSVQQLEGVLGFELLNRTSRQVSLTKPGQIFLQGAYRALSLLEETNEQAQRALKGEAGKLCIGFTDFAITGRLPAILDAFRSAYPDIKLELTHGFTYRQVEDVKEGKLDFGFVTSPIGERELDGITVQKDRLVAVVPSQHPLAARSSIYLKELSEEPFVMGLATGWQHFHLHVQAICLGRGFQPRVIQEAYNSEGIFGFIEANMGVTLHVECVRNYYRKGTTILDLEDVEEQILTEMIWLRGDKTPIQQQFIRFIQQHFSEDKKKSGPDSSDAAVG